MDKRFVPGTSIECCKVCLEETVHLSDGVCEHCASQEKSYRCKVCMRKVDELVEGDICSKCDAFFHTPTRIIPGDPVQSRRDRLAEIAYEGLVIKAPYDEPSESLAIKAYEHADAMITRGSMCGNLPVKPTGFVQFEITYSTSGIVSENTYFSPDSWKGEVLPDYRLAETAEQKRMSGSKYYLGKTPNGDSYYETIFSDNTCGSLGGEGCGSLGSEGNRCDAQVNSCVVQGNS